MTVNQVLHLTDPAGLLREVAGGKGASLADLSQAGFDVPPGFVVTADAFATSLRESEQEIARILGSIEADSVDSLHAAAAKVRELVSATALPPWLTDEIAAAYAAMTTDAEPYVAVRSSAIDEDSAAASFAGLHDTVLDVRGVDGVIEAIRRCWASAWSDRAAVYRRDKGTDLAGVRMAVVVQEMVASDVAGVMFTANPMTGATDEIVINASWGLGEAVVAGLVTPDQYVVSAHDPRLREQIPGEKTWRVVRDPASGRGTVEEPVPDADQRRLCLAPAQVGDLVILARRVQEHAGGFPQDIEWAIVDGRVVLLQSRPVTGIEFSWDADLESWQKDPEDWDVLWTRDWADAYQSHATTPLFHTIRAYTNGAAQQSWAALIGVEEGARQRYFKFHRAKVYWNCDAEQLVVQQTTPAVFRAGRLEWIPPARHQDLLAAPFSYWEFLKQHARIEAMSPSGVRGWFRLMYNYMQNEREYAAGLPDEDLRRLSDIELRRFCDEYVEYERQYISDAWPGFFTYGLEMIFLLNLMLEKWGQGDPPVAPTDLVAGSIRVTETQRENQMLWKISHAIRTSPRLSTIFEEHQDAAFFDRLRADDSPEAADVVAHYQELIDTSGHRGSSAREMAYPTRCEDPSNDYAAIAALLRAPDDLDPARQDEQLNAKREAAVATVLDRIHRQPLGGLKAEAFKIVHQWVLEFIAVRDDERHFFDLFMFTIRRGYLEIGRRLVERGVFSTVDDVFFLGREELYEVLGGKVNQPLVDAKITARRRDFDRLERGEAPPPRFLRRNRSADVEAGLVDDDSDGALAGLPMSAGAVTGTARVVRSLKEMGRVNSGEILVVSATDPAWTSVFLIIKGVVTETGGILSHAACLAREYGMPAVQLPGALHRIEDGATITIHGDTGTVTVHDTTHAS